MSFQIGCTLHGKFEVNKMLLNTVIPITYDNEKVPYAFSLENNFKSKSFFSPQLSAKILDGDKLFSRGMCLAACANF